VTARDSPAVRRSAWRQNRLLLGLVAAALALALVGAGWFVIASRSQPADAALTQARRPYAQVIAGVGSASNLPGLGSAAQVAARNLGILQRASAAAAGAGQAGAPYANLLTAEVAVTQSATKLSELAPGDLTAWASLQPRLSASVKDYEAAVHDLSRVDQAAAQALPDAARALDNVGALVAGSAVSSATAQTSALLTQVAAATKTTDVRNAASSAARLTTSLEALTPTLSQGSGAATSVLALQHVVQSIEPLSSLSANRLHVWSTARGPIAEALGSLPLQSSAMRSLASKGSSALDNVDTVVSRAARAMRSWKAQNASAIRAQQAEQAALSEYSGQMEAEIRTYTSLRTDAANFVNRVESGAPVSYADAYTFLQQAESGRQAVRDAMNALPVPAGMEQAHAALVAILDQAISAIQSARDGIYQAETCTYCYWRDTPGWQTFHSASSAITGEYEQAVAQWQSALVAANRALRTRRLPPEPNV
jgi:hypothetical protein